MTKSNLEIEIIFNNCFDTSGYRWLLSQKKKKGLSMARQVCTWVGKVFLLKRYYIAKFAMMLEFNS